MKRRQKRTILWTMAGLLMSLSVLIVVLTGLSGPVWIIDHEGISQTADAVMSCIQTGNWAGLQELVADHPVLMPQTGNEDSAENFIWITYQQSLQWNCMDGFKIHGAGVTQDVTVTCLDITELTKQMMNILPEITDNSADLSREQALIAAAKQVLDVEMPVMQRKITMTFVRKPGHWMMIPDHTLLALLSGFTGA